MSTIRSRRSASQERHDATEIAVRFVVYDSIIGIVFFTLMAVGGIVGFRILWKRPENAADVDDRMLVRLFVGGLFAALFLVGSTNVFENVSHLLNPEGYLVLKVLKK